MLKLGLVLVRAAQTQQSPVQYIFLHYLFFLFLHYVLNVQSKAGISLASNYHFHVCHYTLICVSAEKKKKLYYPVKMVTIITMYYG